MKQHPQYILDYLDACKSDEMHRFMLEIPQLYFADHDSQPFVRLLQSYFQQTHSKGQFVDYRKNAVDCTYSRISVACSLPSSGKQTACRSHTPSLPT